MSLCDHCGDVSSFGVYWCALCISEESNLLNSLKLDNSCPAYWDGSSYSHGATWYNTDNVSKLKAVPRKGQQ